MVKVNKKPFSSVLIVDFEKVNVSWVLVSFRFLYVQIHNKIFVDIANTLDRYKFMQWISEWKLFFLFSGHISMATFHRKKIQTDTSR